MTAPLLGSLEHFCLHANTTNPNPPIDHQKSISESNFIGITFYFTFVSAE